ncbi:MAG: hypothetical protein M3P26_02430, partial [Gemmatimonadota bacterium]|nr:hypothetical protein [Gemmatimonadota bacterium]
KYIDETKLDVVQATIAYTQYLAEGGSAQVRATPFTGAGSLIRFLPLGVFTALLRPLPGEVNNSFGLLAGLENLVLLTLVLIAIRRTRLTEFRDPVIAWATMLLTTWSVVYGFVSSQNLGTGVRYRLQILPVFLLLLLHLARADRKPLTDKTI